MRAIVTGGAGFIGSHVAEALVARGDEVHVLDNLASGKRENLPEGAQFHEGDIRNGAASVFDEARPEVCFHLAAQADVRVSVERPDYDADVNVLGTLRVLEAARRHGAQVVFASTGGAIYGECEEPATEDADRADDVDVGVEVGPVDRDADVGLRREVEAELGPHLVGERVERLADVADVELGCVRDVLAAPGREIVEDVHLVAAREKRVGDVGADEPRAPCDDRPHGGILRAAAGRSA